MAFRRQHPVHPALRVATGPSQAVLFLATRPRQMRQSPVLGPGRQVQVQVQVLQGLCLSYATHVQQACSCPGQGCWMHPSHCFVVTCGICGLLQRAYQYYAVYWPGLAQSQGSCMCTHSCRTTVHVMQVSVHFSSVLMTVCSFSMSMPYVLRLWWQYIKLHSHTAAMLNTPLGAHCLPKLVT